MIKKSLLSLILIVAILLTSSLVAFAAPTSTMKLGSKGPDVKDLQLTLIELGHLEKKYATGFFGPNTEEAVKLYQKSQNIKQTGVVAALTLEALFSYNKFDTSLVLKNGDEGNNVKRLQQALSDMGFLAKDKITGHFGDITEAAVKKFQEANSIQSTGTAAKLTLEKINTLMNVTKLDTTRVYKSGDEDSGVKALQKRLCELGYLEDKYADTDSVKASKKMFDAAGVKYRAYTKKGEVLSLDL